MRCGGSFVGFVAAWRPCGVVGMADGASCLFHLGLVQVAAALGQSIDGFTLQERERPVVGGVVCLHDLKGPVARDDVSAQDFRPHPVCPLRVTGSAAAQLPDPAGNRRCRSADGSCRGGLWRIPWSPVQCPFLVITGAPMGRRTAAQLVRQPLRLISSSREAHIDQRADGAQTARALTAAVLTPPWSARWQSRSPYRRGRG